jgi:hypothetical protein
MSRFAWGVFWAVVQLSPVVAFSADTGIVKFGCDNDRISVAIEPRRTAIEIFRGAGQGDYLFTSNGVATPNQTWAVGSSSDHGFRLSIRKDHWARVTVSSRDGRLIADELVFCNNP